jgi:Bifunctional DNA primase/polymerase, N-terminal
VLQFYIERGWNPVPIPFQAKGPTEKNWQKRRIDLTNVIEFFPGILSDKPEDRRNIGIQLGPMSGDLVDVDLDCQESLTFAPLLMPPTPAIFGRRSKPASHRLYVSHYLHQIALKAAVQFKDPHAPDDKTDDRTAMLLEVRIGGGGKGAQTIAPGSVHASGEAVEWCQGPKGDGGEVGGQALLKAAGRSAAGCLIARYWPPEGRRHDAALIAGGFLARCAFSSDEAELFMEAVARAAEDEEPDDRVRCVRDSIAAFAAGKPVAGLPKLAEAFGADIAGKCAEWLHFQDGGGSTAENGVAVRAPTPFGHRTPS